MPSISNTQGPSVTHSTADYRLTDISVSSADVGKQMHDGVSFDETINTSFFEEA